MRELAIIYWFQLKGTLKRKGILISTLFIAALIFGGAFFSHQSSKSESVRTVAISMDENIKPLTEAYFKEQFDTSDVAFDFVSSSDKELEKGVKEKKWDSAFSLQAKDGDVQLLHYYRFYADTEIMTFVETVLEEHALSVSLDQSGLPPTLLSDIDNSIQFKTKEVNETEQTYALVYPLIFLMYVFVMGFGQMIAMAVTNEKSTKVIEMLLPKIEPIHSFYAKIASTFTIGLLQLSVTGLSFLGVRLLGWAEGGSLDMLGFEIRYSDIEPSMIILFLVCFIWMFAFYGLIYGAIGSKVSRVEDLNPLLTPVVFLLLGAFILSIFSVFNPESTVSLIGSFIPFFSPLVLFVRIVIGVASLTEVIIGFLILLISTYLLSKWCEQWYLQGISHYGKKAKKKKTT